MFKHNETGIKGEAIAVKFLQKKGFIIIAQNWRFEKKEIDIIAKFNNILVFVEVKTRSNLRFGPPEESVGVKKQAFLKFAAEAFLAANNYNDCPIRFDVISIMLERGTLKDIQHFEDAF